MSTFIIPHSYLCDIIALHYVHLDHFFKPTPPSFLFFFQTSPNNHNHSFLLIFTPQHIYRERESIPFPFSDATDKNSAFVFRETSSWFLSHTSHREHATYLMLENTHTHTKSTTLNKLHQLSYQTYTTLCSKIHLSALYLPPSV